MPQCIYLFSLQTSVWLTFLLLSTLLFNSPGMLIQECLWDIQRGKLVGHRASKFSYLSKMPKCLQLDHLTNSSATYEHNFSNTR